MQSPPHPNTPTTSNLGEIGTAVTAVIAGLNLTGNVFRAVTIFLGAQVCEEDITRQESVAARFSWPALLPELRQINVALRVSWTTPRLLLRWSRNALPRSLHLSQG